MYKKERILELCQGGPISTIEASIVLVKGLPSVAPRSHRRENRPRKTPDKTLTELILTKIGHNSDIIRTKIGWKARPRVWSTGGTWGRARNRVTSWSHQVFQRYPSSEGADDHVLEGNTRRFRAQGCRSSGSDGNSSAPTGRRLTNRFRAQGRPPNVDQGRAPPRLPV